MKETTFMYNKYDFLVEYMNKGKKYSIEHALKGKQFQINLSVLAKNKNVTVVLKDKKGKVLMKQVFPVERFVKITVPIVRRKEI